MTQNLPLDHGDPAAEGFFDATQEMLSGASTNFRLSLASATTIQVVAGADDAQVAISIGGQYRWITATINRAHPGGAAATYDVHVTSPNNAGVTGLPAGADPSFALAITAAGVPPAGVDRYRKVATLAWDGAAITSITPIVGTATLGDLASYVPRSGAVAAATTLVENRLLAADANASFRATGDGALYWGAGGGSASDTKLYRSGIGTLKTDTNFAVGGTLAVAGGSPATGKFLQSADGVGTAQWATVTIPTTLPPSGAASGDLAGTYPSPTIAASVALTGVPTAPTAAVDTNTTQLATVAFVLAQASASGDGTPAMDGTAARGTSTHYARADHVHPTDTSRAPLASPTFTGTPAAPTAAVDTNTTQIATTAFVLAQAAAATPVMDGVAAVGTSTRYARADHVHATDTSRAPLASPTFTGVPAAPTAAVDTNTTQVATTAFVLAQAASATPLIDGTATVGTSTRYARGDHVHPTDTSRAPLASPTFTGVPAAPTAAVDTNSTQIATTAYVVGQGYAKLASPTLTGTPAAPTAAASTNTTQIATTAFVRAENATVLGVPHTFVERRAAWGDGAFTTGTYTMAGDSGAGGGWTLSTSNSWGLDGMFKLDPAEHAQTGRTLKARIAVDYVQGSTINNFAFSVQLIRHTAWTQLGSTASAAASLTTTLTTNRTANADWSARGSWTDISGITAGIYVLAMVVSGTVNIAAIGARLEFQWV